MSELIWGFLSPFTLIFLWLLWARLYWRTHSNVFQISNVIYAWIVQWHLVAYFLVHSLTFYKSTAVFILPGELSTIILITLALFHDSFQSFWFRLCSNVTIIIIMTAFIIFPFLTVQFYSIFIDIASVTIKRTFLGTLQKRWAPDRQQWQEKLTGRNLDQDQDHNAGVEMNELSISVVLCDYSRKENSEKLYLAPDSDIRMWGNWQLWEMTKKIRKPLCCISCGGVSFTLTVEGNRSDTLMTKLQNCLCV